jgi:hypothetical protein
VALADTCVWHYPASVTRVTGVRTDEDQVAEPERQLIDSELQHYPPQTLAPHYSNGILPGPALALASTLGSGAARYPLLRRSERRRCWSEYYLGRFGNRPGITRLAALVQAAAYWPANPALRHAVRKAWSRRSERRRSL